MVVDILMFDLGGELYAMDIQIAREIVDMLPITPIPKAPAYVTGLLNLRGEITTIINIHQLLGISASKPREEQKMIILIPDIFENTSVGIIVDEVHSVLTVDDDKIDSSVEGVDSDLSQFVQGIIKLGTDDNQAVENIDETGSMEGQKLVIWIDIKKILMDTIEIPSARQE